MNILGVSALYHDSAAVLVKDGQVICGAEEERFSRIKHDNEFPFKAIEFCLKQSGLLIEDVEYLAYYEKPLRKFERILENFVETYPFSSWQFTKAIREWLGHKIKVEQIIKKELGFKGKIFFIPHHLSHASAAFFTSDFEESAVLTVDGVGEYQTTALWRGSKNNLRLIKSLNFPHSLGLLYSTFTAFLGFRVNEDEYKVMGMAAYGKPILEDKVKLLINVKDDGSFQFNMEFFGFRNHAQMWTGNFEKLFGPPRKSTEPITDAHKNIAASIQRVTENIYFSMLKELYSIADCPNVAISGGVALNALANGKIFSHTPFKNVHILGPAGDSGAALGAALFIFHHLQKPTNNNPLSSLYLGSAYPNEVIKVELEKRKLLYKQFESEHQFLEAVAGLLNQDKVVGWFQGPMEFGPRALGARSILAKPNPKMVKDRVNQIKKRELFRPFAGSIIKEFAGEFFETPVTQTNFPQMNFCFKVKANKQNELAAIVHADGSCRIQTVTAADGRYHKLLKEFYEVSGLPCLLNTSFNLSGEPIVETPEQAVNDFLKSPIDYLAMGDFLIYKE